MEEAMQMTGTFGWTMKIDWDSHAQGMDHKKAKRMQKKMKLEDTKKKTKRKQSRWGIRLQPLQLSIGLGSRTIHHYFNHSPSVKRTKQRRDDPIERNKRLERNRRLPRQRVDDELRASNGNHTTYHVKRCQRIEQPKRDVSITMLSDGQDDSLVMAQAAQLQYVRVPEKNTDLTVLRGPLHLLHHVFKAMQELLPPVMQEHLRIVSDDFDVLSRYYLNPECPVQMLCRNTIDGFHSRTGKVMLPDENEKNGVPAKNTLIVRLWKQRKTGRTRTLLKKMNKAGNVPLLLKTDIELMMNRAPSVKMRYGRGCSTSCILPIRKHPAQSYCRETRIRSTIGLGIDGAVLPVTHPYTWNFLGPRMESP